MQVPVCAELIGNIIVGFFVFVNSIFGKSPFVFDFLRMGYRLLRDKLDLCRFVWVIKYTGALAITSS